MVGYQARARSKPASRPNAVSPSARAAPITIPIFPSNAWPRRGPSIRGDGSREPAACQLALGAAGAFAAAQPHVQADEPQLHEELQLHAGAHWQGWHLQWVVMGTSWVSGC